MADESQNTKMKTKWTGPYTIIEVTIVGRYELQGKHGHCLKTHFPPRHVKHYYQGIQAEDDEDPCPVHMPAQRLQMWKSVSYNLVESHNIFTIIYLLKPIVKNPEHHPMSGNSEEMELGVPNPCSM